MQTNVVEEAMPKKFLILFLLFCCSFKLYAEKKYYLSICAIFKNEAPYLKEWIEYHRLVGVEHFYLYNHESSDNFSEVLQPYVESGLVEITNWFTIKLDHFWTEAQLRAYNNCVQKTKSETTWLAVVDIDEFIVPVKDPDLAAYLTKYDDIEEVGGIRINWQLYGTSWLPSIPKDKLLIESLVWKAETDYYRGVCDNYMVKSIVKPDKVLRFTSAHTAKYLPGFHHIPRARVDNQVERKPVEIDEIRINHYWTRADDFFHVKVERRKAFGFTEKELYAIYRDLNEVEDRIMDKYIPQLRQVMGLD